MQLRSSFFKDRQKTLMMAFSVYVLALIAAHVKLPSLHVWIIAAVFSSAMNFTYVTEAYALGKMRGLETFVMVVLIFASLLGVLVSPAFVIFAIFAHGFWDLAKHFGAGIPFFSWYVLSCCAVDVSYGTVLLVYWMFG